jgi:hypothetical protein
VGKLYYRKGYKYQAAQDCSCQTEISGIGIDQPFYGLTPDGILTGKRGYAWDGPSGPTYDSRYCMRGPFFHDIGYQMMREQRIPLTYKPYFDGLMWRIIKEDIEIMILRYKPAVQGIIKKAAEARALAWYNAVYYLAESAALPENDRKILEAP